ncbi:MAG: hypothetical protein IPM91_17730 [Bacteroidetes bacterium]|nr:hypothetical protein [Bacteroidota bacterium]
MGLKQYRLQKLLQPEFRNYFTHHQQWSDVDTTGQQCRWRRFTGYSFVNATTGLAVGSSGTIVKNY